MKKMVITFLGVIGVCLISITYYFVPENKAKVINDTKANHQIMNSSTLSMMYETSANSGIYEAIKDNKWPTSGYIFNETLSKCENGSELSWDDSTKKVIMTGSASDKCYVYFDKELLLSNYIKGLYTTQGANNLYHHDGTLENGINDGSYRYSGAYESVNNWVCFGYDDPTGNYANGWCPANNLYRIIGVFNEKVLNEDGTDSGKNEERVKLIMNDYPGESVLGKARDGAETPSSSFTGVSKPSGAVPAYAWSGSTSVNSNNWLTSTLNTSTLNGTYLTTLGNEWAKIIALTEWKIDGNTYSSILDVNAATTYQNEIVSPAQATTDKKKVGLMYAHDYGFATSKENWTTNLNSYGNDRNQNNNWLYRGVTEWTISHLSSNSNSVFNVPRNGRLYYDGAVYGYGVRPNLYLEASVTYASGEGTQTNPIRIS